MAKIRCALISVSDKRGVVEFAKFLSSMGTKILSTGGTAKALREAGIEVQDVSEYTGFPEMLDGRLKTLHPKIHGGLLGKRDNKKHLKEMQEHGIEPIDMVVVNLYPFEETISKPDVSFHEAIENIDIGGPTMLRAAAKNFQDVAVVVDPNDYDRIRGEIESLNGEISYRTRVELAKKVFKHTSRYDTLIADYLSGVTEKKEGFDDTLTMTFRLGSALRYGENPHQRAAVYFEKTDGLSLNALRKIQGKEMSFNNYSDIHTAMLLVTEFAKTACAIVKHTNPCGCALGESALEAYTKAAKTDPVSAFGGVIAFNTGVDAPTAEAIAGLFVEAVIAPSYDEDAIKVFSKKPNIRVLELPDMLSKKLKGMDIKRIAGGVLVQDWDSEDIDIESLQAVTKRKPSPEERQALAFAWKVAKHVKSNAVVYAFKDRTIGIGIGQTSRAYSAKTGAINALEPLKGSVVASDGFFPFRDSIDAIHKVGVTAVIQPGGSIRDEEVIKAADEYDMAMLFTGIRHFRH